MPSGCLARRQVKMVCHHEVVNLPSSHSDLKPCDGFCPACREYVCRECLVAFSFGCVCKSGSGRTTLPCGWWVHNRDSALKVHGKSCGPLVDCSRLPTPPRAPAPLGERRLCSPRKFRVHRKSKVQCGDFEVERTLKWLRKLGGVLDGRRSNTQRQSETHAHRWIRVGQLKGKNRRKRGQNRRNRDRS